MHERIPPQTGRITTEELWADFAVLQTTNTHLPENEYATWTIPRSSTEWRIASDDVDNYKVGEPLMLPMRYDIEQFRNPELSRYVKYRATSPPPNAYMTVLPQPSVMHEARARDYIGYTKSMLKHYALENSLARRYGVPMLLMRFDSVDDKFGNGQIAELDDVNSLWSRLRIVNPIAASYLDAMESQLGMPIYSVELFDHPHSWQSKGFTYEVDVRQPGNNIKLLADWSYLHDDDWWRGNVHDINTQIDYMAKHCKSLNVDEVALIIRARRQNPKFKDFMDTYGKRSITMAWERDDKWPLVAASLGALAANVEVALEFVAEYIKAYPQENLVLKARYGARTERVAITKAVGQREQGVFSHEQIRRKFERAGAANESVIIQPFKRPPTLAEDGFTFQDGDQAAIRSVQHISHGRNYEPGKRAAPGQEGKIKRINRHYVVYLPKEERLVPIGGWWWASEGFIVHGSSNSFCGPLYIAGLQAHPSHRNQDTAHAERMLASYDDLRYIDQHEAFDLRRLQQTGI